MIFRAHRPLQPLMPFEKDRGRLATKMNITFFMGNEVLNIFSSNNFFEENNIFRENDEKTFLEDTAIF